MPECACRFDGPLMSDEHRAHHRAWEQRTQQPAGHQDAQLVAVLVQLDQVIARLIECERRLDITPMAPTPGAQAILTRAAQERRA